MLSSREIKPLSDETRSNSVARPKSPNILRHMCKQVDQANRDSNSASSSPRDTGKRPLSAWEVKQLEEMPIGEDSKRAEKVVIPERGLKGGMWGGDGGASSSDGSKRRLEQLIMKEVDEVLGNARVGIDSQDCKNLDKLAKDLGVRTVVEALKKKFETERHQSIIQAIIHLGNPKMDLPFLEEAFIKEGCKRKWEAPPGLETTASALAKFGGKEALPAIETVFYNYARQGIKMGDLVKTIAELKGEFIYRYGRDVYRAKMGEDGVFYDLFADSD